AELAADQERAQEAALDVVHSAQSASECTYRQIMLGIHDHGELYLDFVIGTADQVSADELLAEIGADARHAQSVADRRDNADRAASRAARSHVGRTVARSEGIFFDTDVKLAEVLEPAAGLPTQDEALGFARIRGRACAVVQVGARWHVFALDEQLDYDDIWQTDAWQEHRTRLVPVGAAARLLVTRDGYVVRVRDGRFFGGDQSRRPAAYMHVDAELLANRVEELTDAQAVRLFKQLVRDDILLRLDDARTELVRARHCLRPDRTGAPDATEARQLRQDAAALRRHMLAAGGLAARVDGARDGLDEAGVGQLRETLAAIGRIVADNPAAAMMVVDERDADEREQAPEADDIVDRTADVARDSHASWAAINEINRRLDNIEEVQRHLHADPDSVLALEPVHERYLSQFTATQQLRISLARAGHHLSAFASAVGMTVLELGLVVTGLFTGGLTSLLAGTAAAALGARGTQQAFQRAHTLEAMSALDMTGGLSLASPEAAASARLWARVGLGLSFLEVGGVVRSARHLARLQTVLESPELSRVLAHSQHRMGEIANDLGMSEAELVRRLHTLRGRGREQLLGRIREAAEPARSGGRQGYGNRLEWEAAGFRFSELEAVRQRLLARGDITAVLDTLHAHGVPADRAMVEAVKRYNFDSAGLGFYYDNYAAWNRLARGQAQVRDIQYFVHEMTEVSELQRVQRETGFDFMGRGFEKMTGRRKGMWNADFRRIYGQAHNLALQAEYDFVAREVARLTGNRVRISRTVAAAVDSIRKEARHNMLVDGIRLRKHPKFHTWQARGRETVELGRGAMERLGLPRHSPLYVVVDAVRRSRL
ncbi:MAG: hypothetical protein MJE77_20060, partial [Proteobacteria bacterium]|nr:hypothetical protein [Pseudomonadota bacterium]